MTDLVIPKGKEFEFTIKVMEKDSFLAQNLENVDTATLTILGIVTQEAVTTTPLTVLDSSNGVLKGSIPASETSKLTVHRGPAEDGYYLKPGYQASMTVTFTDDTESINVLIERIMVAPTGV